MSGGKMTAFVSSSPRRRAVTRAEFEGLRRRLEELEDLARLREAAATTKPEDYLPVALVKRELAGEHPLRIWREHRGFSAKALAARADIPQGYLSEIETRKKPGSVAAYRALARALDVPLDRIAP